MPNIMETIRNIRRAVVPTLSSVCTQAEFMKFHTFCGICPVLLLQNSSKLSGAEKLNSAGLQGHDSLFPPVLCPTYSAHASRTHTLQELIDCGCTHEFDIIYYPNTLYALLPPRHPDIPTSPVSSTALWSDKLTTCERRKLMRNTPLFLNNYRENAQEEGS